MNAIETISYKGHEIGIYYDEYAESPRAWDNLSMIYSNSRRYNPDGLDIDDLMNEIGISEFPGFDNILSRMEHDYIAYRVCIVDHSGVALSLNSPVPNLIWDSIPARLALWPYRKMLYAVNAE